MKLKRVYVENLFGSYKYDLNLIDPKLSHVTIIDAPNGMGKTTMLKLVQAAFQGDILYIDSIPFSLFGIEFDEGQSISIKKDDVYESVMDRNFFEIRNSIVHQPNQELVNETKNNIEIGNMKFFINDKPFSVFIQRDFIFALTRRVRVDRNTMVNVSISDLIPRDDFNNEDIFIMDELMNALAEFTTGLKIYFIKTNRLYRKNDRSRIREERYRGQMDSRNDMVSAVELYKEKIKAEILAVGKKFADKSEELDRSFPQRVLNMIFKEDQASEIYDKEIIENLLKDLEQTRSELGELGLITGAGDSLVKIPARESLSEQTRIFLTNYIEDNITKLEIYKELSEKLRLLRSIVNDRNVFTDKEMRFSAKEGVEFVSLKNDRTIPADKLSSGEKNNFVLFYELIFECGQHSLILIDEPEISLHVAWQRQFIDELNEICTLKGLQGIVATHSPDIVGDNVEFMVDLEDISDGEE